MGRTNIYGLRTNIPALPKSLDVTDVDDAAADPDFDVGGTYYKDGKRYRYVQFVDVATVAITAGSVVQFTGTAGEVTADISASADATHGKVAGIAIHTPTADYYGFIQTGGTCTAITTDGNVAAGDFLVSGADGVADPYAISDTPSTSGANADAGRIFGQALVADTSTTLTLAEIWCP